MRCKRTDQSAATVVCFMSPPAKGRRVLTYIRSQRICRSQCVFKNYLRIFCICHSFDIRIEEPYRQTPSDNNAAHGGSGDKLTESQFISSQLIRHEHNTLIRMLSFLRTRCRRCAVHCIALCIGVAGSFSEGGQPFCPAKIQNFPAKIFSCQGGQVLQFCPAKLLLKATLPNCSANGQKLQING